MTGFLFPKDIQDNLPISMRKRVPMLIATNIIMILYLILASLTRYLANPVEARVFFIAINATQSLYLVSLVLIKGRLFVIASVVSTLAMLLNTIWLGILLPMNGPEVLYRFTVYLLAAALANSMISIDRKQIPIYALVSILVYIVITLTVHAPRFGGMQGELRTIFTTTVLVIVAVNIVLILTNRLSSDLISLAEHEVEFNRRKATELSALVSDARSYMEVGQALLGASAAGQKAGSDIRKELESISTDVSGLARDARRADEANTEVVIFSKGMRQAVERQNQTLGETSRSIGEIMASIQNMADLAQDKRQIMDAVLKNVEAQAQHVRMVSDGFNKIRDASKKVLGVVSGIMDITEKTNLLAMNASIEAAHAGSSGKGFAVIAQEIRKLSEESRTNTESVQAALVQNDAIVRQVAEAASTFTTEIGSVNSDVKLTFNAMDELITGLSGIASATHDLRSSTTNMVEIANEANRDVGGVVDRVGLGSESVAQISRFSNGLEEQMERLSKEFSALEEALNKIRSIGNQNIEQIADFERELKAIQG